MQRLLGDRSRRGVEKKIPEGVRESLRVTMIGHAVCVANSPQPKDCVIADLCPSASARLS